MVAFFLNAHASDMAIVEAVTGNMKSAAPTEAQSKTVSSSSKRSSPQPISKFDYEARQALKEMTCDAPENPELEPYKYGVQILIFTCNDGRELKIQCSASEKCHAL